METGDEQHQSLTKPTVSSSRVGRREAVMRYRANLAGKALDMKTRATASVTQCTSCSSGVNDERL